MAQLIGTAPNQVPTNADLGTMAFQDPAGVNITGGTITATRSAPDITGYQLVANSYPVTPPALMLDFANSKALDPRITFARTSTGTYYDGKTTAVAEQNLLTYSQAIGSTGWSSNGATATLNIIAAPDGTTTASLITETVTLNSHDFYSSSQPATVVGTTYTYSVYMKAGTRTWGVIRSFQSAGGATAHKTAYFDLTNGVLGTVDSPFVATITSVGSGWYRCSVTYTAVYAGSLAMSQGITSTNGIYTYTGDGTSGIYIWGAQLEQRSSVTAYTPTTTAAITNYIPVLQTAAANVARFDSNPTTGESLGLLIEEQRTNLVTQSQTFSSWNNPSANGSLVFAANTAPDGTLTAAQFVENTSIGTRFQQLNVTGSFAANSSLSLSIYTKTVSYPTMTLGLADLTNTGSVVPIFNTSTGTVATPGVTSGNLTFVSNTITPVGNGWYRVTLSVTLGALASTLMRVQVGCNGFTSYTGNGYNSTYLWGAQLEAGAFATSYIPTVSSPLPRGADLASMTGTNFSSWFNQSQGSLYWESSGHANTVDQIMATFFNTSPITVYWFYNNTVNGTGSTAIYNNGSQAVNGGAILANTMTKYASSFNFGNTLVAAISGTVIGSTALRSGATVTGFYLSDANGGNKPMSGRIKRITYYPVALTATQLQLLTS